MLRRIWGLALCLALLFSVAALAEAPDPNLCFTIPVSGDPAESDSGDAPAPAEAPTVEALADGYFGVLAGLESGTAGASLKTAIAAAEVCAFAEAHDLYNTDVQPLRANLQAALVALDEDRQAAFWAGFDAVCALLDACLDDYDAQRPLFEDAGVAEAMDEVMYDPLNRLAWRNLRDHTLALGSDVNAG